MRFIVTTTSFFLISTQAFSATGNSASYIEMASNNKLGMNLRWDAVLKAADFSDGESRLNLSKQIKKFVLSKDWYMRNAALLALLKINPEEAMSEAKKLLQDKALVVRSAAVEILAQDLSSMHKKILNEELSKPYNFHKKSSLWIRKQIIEKLALSADIQDRDIFVKNLFDTDKEISQICAITLEKITGQYVGKTKSNVKYDVKREAKYEANHVEKWKAIVKLNNWL